MMNIDQKNGIKLAAMALENRDMLSAGKASERKVMKELPADNVLFLQPL